VLLDAQLILFVLLDLLDITENKQTMKAIWNNQTLAESNDIIIVDDNHYFPMSSLNINFFNASVTQRNCPLKGDASYYSITVNGKDNIDAAWYYPCPKSAAKQISNRIAFRKDVVISD